MFSVCISGLMIRNPPRPYDTEPATVSLMHAYAERQGYMPDITDKRLHHEIYLSDARKVAPEKLKTVIRHPIRKG